MWALSQPDAGVGDRAHLQRHQPDPDALLAMLKPYPASRMKAYKVGQAIGKVKNSDASVAEPIGA